PHDVTLYVSRESFDINKTLYQCLAFRIKPILFFTFLIAKLFPEILQSYMASEQQRERYDIWQVVGAYPGGYLVSTLRGSVPVVVRTHGEDIQKDIDLDYGKRLNATIEGRIKRVLHSADRVVALTKSVVDCYKELGVSDDNIVEIPNGIDLDRFQKEINRDTIRKKYDIAQNVIVLLTVGRYHRKKDFDIIPKVARALKTEGVSFCWLVAGSNTEQLIPLCKQEEVGDVVKIIGEVDISQSVDEQEGLKIPGDNLIDLYKCADIFVFPSRLETFGRVLIEAMASGACVVTTDAPGCRDVVKHKESGLLVRPGNINEFVSSIYLIEDSNVRQQLIQGGLREVQKYGWDNIIDAYEKLYDSLLLAHNGKK
ncbi:glycosyltransferase family 4 protein, partial [Thermoproteota archaeon]